VFHVRKKVIWVWNNRIFIFCEAFLVTCNINMMTFYLHIFSFIDMAH